MQAHQLAEFGEPDALAVTRDFFQDRERTPERLHAAALAVLGVVVDVGLSRLHQAGDRRLAWTGRLVAGLQLGARCHGISSPHGREFYSHRPRPSMRDALLRAAWRAYHNSN